MSKHSYNCHDLVFALTDWYKRRSYCFRLSVNKRVKLYIDLIDILYILGFPIVIQPLVKVETCATYKRFFLFLLGMPNLHFKSRGFKLGALKTIALDQTNSLETRVRATVLYLLGCTIFLDSSTDSMKGLYGAFLEKIQEIREYTREMCLVEINHWLWEYNKKYVGNGGCMIALMVSDFYFLFIFLALGYGLLWNWFSHYVWLIFSFSFLGFFFL